MESLSATRQGTVWVHRLIIAVQLAAYFFLTLRHRAFTEFNVIVSILSMLLLTGLPIYNLYHHGNPTYPAKPPVISEKMPAIQSLNSDRENWLNTPKLIQPWPNPVRFFYSAFEANRLFPSKNDYLWTFDQAVNDGQNESPHHRIGGWFWLPMLLHTIAIAFLLFSRHLRERVTLYAILLAIFGIYSNQFKNWHCRLWVVLDGLISFLVKACALAVFPRFEYICLPCGAIYCPPISFCFSRSFNSVQYITDYPDTRLNIRRIRSALSGIFHRPKA